LSDVLQAKRYISMLDFINRHKIEKRLGNLNPDPIVPVDFKTSEAIPRHIAKNSEEHDIYNLLQSKDKVFPVK
jgi:hypothetical protein